MEQHFALGKTIPAQHDIDVDVSRIASAIGEPARARMLMTLLDDRARTSTELAVTAGVAAPTASIHLSRLRSDGLVKVAAQGRHRYYTLESREVASVLEKLCSLAGREGVGFQPSTPEPLRKARTCYDHMAGTFAVALHDHLLKKQWLTRAGQTKGNGYDLSAKGLVALQQAGIKVKQAMVSRRRFAFGCLDWSERRPHLAGSLASAMFARFVERKWVIKDLEGRGLFVTNSGKHGLYQELDFCFETWARPRSREEGLTAACARPKQLKQR